MNVCTASFPGSVGADFLGMILGGEFGVVVTLGSVDRC